MCGGCGFFSTFNNDNLQTSAFFFGIYDWNSREVRPVGGGGELCRSVGANGSMFILSGDSIGSVI